MDHAAELRSDLDRTKQGIKEGMMHAAFVPDSIILKMMFEDRVNFYDRNQRKEVLKLIETKYPKFKTTDKRLA